MISRYWIDRDFYTYYCKKYINNNDNYLIDELIDLAYNNRNTSIIFNYDRLEVIVLMLEDNRLDLMKVEKIIKILNMDMTIKELIVENLIEKTNYALSQYENNRNMIIIERTILCSIDKLPKDIDFTMFNVKKLRQLLDIFSYFDYNKTLSVFSRTQDNNNYYYDTNLDVDVLISILSEKSFFSDKTIKHLYDNLSRNYETLFIQNLRKKEEIFIADNNYKEVVFLQDVINLKLIENNSDQRLRIKNIKDSVIDYISSSDDLFLIIGIDYVILNSIRNNPKYI